MLVYDFEVFKEDWLTVVLDLNERKEHVIVNDKDQLESLYNKYSNDIWVGFNNKGYDQYIFKGILAGFNPKEINDFIIVKNKPGYQFSSLLNRFPMNNYDVFNRGLDPSLKVFEGYMGNDINESSVPFNLDRKLTDEEIEETIKYCRHDVEQTFNLFMERYADFEAHMGLIKYYANGSPLQLNLLSKTKVQLSALILNAERSEFNDEFDIDLPPTLKIEKYKEVVEWYQNPNNRAYFKTVDGKPKANKLEIMIAGVPHVFGWGGVHGAIDKYQGEGYYLNMDVASLYPSLMIQYNLGSRAMHDPKKYEDIYHQRLKYKAEKNPLQAPLKIVLNGTYGAMKDKYNPLYDPRQANRVCVYGQLLLLDLIEKLEPHCDIIQSNTDGVLVKLRDKNDYALIDDIAYEWEQRTRLQLEFDEYKRVYQKDVNNYIIVGHDGHHKSKGAYVKKLSNIDNNLPIVNKALVDYMVSGVPIETTINNCNDLKMFQMIARASYKYKCLMYGEHELPYKTVRIYADNRNAPGLYKVSLRTGKPEKVANTPEHVNIFNSEVNEEKVYSWLDKQFYIDMAYKRLQDFGGE